MDCGKLSEWGILPKGTYDAVVHSNGNIALVECRVGAAREHREVDHVRESSQHLFVNGAEIDCGEIVARERGEHRVSRGENVYKVEPQRTKIRLNTCCRHPFSHPPLSSSLLGGLPSFVDESGGNIGNGGD